MRLYIFDFDMTLTFLQTDSKSYLIDEQKHPDHAAFIRENMKPNVAELFRSIWRAGDIVAIATFSENKPLLIEHIQSMGLTENELSNIIIETRPENYEELWRAEQAGGDKLNKNNQATRIIKRVGRDVITEVIYADDSPRNIDAMKEMLDGLKIPNKTIWVPTRQTKGADGLAIDPRCDFIEELLDFAPFKDPIEAILAGAKEKVICELITPHNANITDDANFSLLHYAVKAGMLTVVQKSIMSGANLDARNISDRTPLFEAARIGRVDIATELLDKGADPNAEDKSHDTPLLIATECEQIEMVTLLTEKCATVKKTF
ncbi:MAG: ankyrin repeat domain-containing protein [Pseudomonadota bacterium]|nr:ankyrin repeat domain-containing protein [Pseudomonadota bacterium]